VRGRLDGSAGTRRRLASGGPGPAGSPEGRGASTDVTSRRAGWVPGCRVARGSRPAAAALDRGGESRTACGPASQSQPGVPLRRASSGTGRAAPREPARVPYHLMKVRGRPIVTKFLGRPGQGTGSRVEGRHFIKLWYEGGIPLWNDKLLCGTRP